MMKSVNTVADVRPAITVMAIGPAYLRALARPEGHRDKPEHGCQRRHHDGSQPHNACLHERVRFGQSTAAKLVDVIHQDDRVVYDDARQHDSPDEDDHAEIDGQPVKNIYDADECQRHAKHDQGRVPN